MPLRLPRRPDRSPPNPEQIRKDPASLDREREKPSNFDAERHAAETREYLRKSEERRRRDYKEIEDSMPGDRRDEVQIVSKGPGVEVSARHGLANPPDRYDVCFQDGDGRVYASRGIGNLADEESVYFKTSAVAGTTFCVRLYAKQDKGDRIGAPSKASTFLGGE